VIRCIEEAIKAGMISREDGRRLQEQVDKLLDHGLGGADVRRELSASLAAEAKETKRRALLMEARRKVLTDVVLNHRNARGENDPAQALWLLLDDTAQAGVQGIETRRMAIIGDAHRQLDDLLHEFRKGWLLGDKRRQRQEVQASMRNLVREVFGEDSGDAAAKELAGAWHKVTDQLRQRANKAGMAIGSLENWGMPQTHNREALLRAGRETWVDYMMQPGRLDRERMAQWLGRDTYTDDELREALEHAWGEITSDGAFSRQPTYAGQGKGSLARRFDARHRWIHFASADESLAYAKNFGEGDPYRTMMQHINLMARDIATLEVLGPNPEAMGRYLKALVAKTAAEVEPAGEVLRNAMVRLRQMVEATGTGDGGRAALEKVEAKIAELGHARRQARAAEAPGESARQVEKQLEAAIRDLGHIESRATAEGRAALEAELTRIDGMLDALQREGAPHTRLNLPKRHRERMDDLGLALREVDERRVAAREISPKEARRLDALIAAATDRSGIMQPDDVLPALGLSRADNAIVGKLERIKRGLGRAYEQRAEEWTAADGFWVPKEVRDRLLDVRDMTEMVKYLEGLRWGGLVEARQRHLESLRNTIVAERQALLGATPLAEVSLTRRNRRRVAELTGERASVRRQLDALAENATTIGTHDPQAWREILRQVRTAQAATDEVTVVGTDTGFLSVSKPQDAARVAIDKFDRLWSLSRGTYFVPVNSWWADALQAMRNLTTAHLLGSAAITAIGDLSTQSVARKMTGMSGNLLTVTRGIFEQIGNASRREAVQAGLILDEALHVASQEARFMDQVNTVHLTGYIADRVLGLSSLSWLTQSGKHAFGLAFQGHVGNSLHRSFDELAKIDPALERLLRRNGFTSSDWEMLRASQVHEPRPGARFLRPAEVADGPGGQALSEKYLATILRMTRMAVVEGTPEARIMWGGGRPGTFIGEVSRNMAQFRSYSAGFLLLHMRDILWTSQAGRKSDAALRAAGLVVTGTLLGALAIDLNELSDGNDPLFAGMLARGEMPDWQIWGKAWLKAGGAGIYGDFLFASTDFLSKGAVETLAGPLPGTLESVRRQAAVEIKDSLHGKLDPVGAKRLGLATAKSFMPGSTLWWAKKAFRTYVFDQIDYLIDPARAQRSWRTTERLRRNSGFTNKSWWKRGELLPERGPALAP